MNPTGKGGFQRGQSGNPHGRPKGSRDRLTSAFIDDLADDYAENGTAAIVKVREKHPDRYLALICNLLPRKIDVDTTFTLLDLLTGIGADDEPSEDQDEPLRH